MSLRVRPHRPNCILRVYAWGCGNHTHRVSTHRTCHCSGEKEGERVGVKIQRCKFRCKFVTITSLDRDFALTLLSALKTGLALYMVPHVHTRIPLSSVSAPDVCVSPVPIFPRVFTIVKRTHMFVHMCTLMCRGTHAHTRMRACVRALSLLLSQFAIVHVSYGPACKKRRGKGGTRKQTSAYTNPWTLTCIEQAHLKIL